MDDGVAFEAYRALAEKAVKERNAYRRMLDVLIDQADTIAMRRDSHRWKQQRYGVVSHGYPGCSLDYMKEEKLGRVGSKWEEFGDYAVVAVRLDENGKIDSE